MEDDVKRDELIEKAQKALKEWDRYQPDISTDKVIAQACDLADCLRDILDNLPVG